MKTIIFTFLTFAILGKNIAVCQVGIGTTTPSPSSVLDLTSTNKGFLPPRMTTIQRNAIASPAEGLTIYNTNTKCLQYFTGFAWFNPCTNTSETPPAVVPVGGGVTKAFSQYNLGADTTLDPRIPVVGLQGAYIQWGMRGPNITGDSRIDWQTAPNNGPLGFAAAPTATNANAGSIVGWNETVSSDGSWNSGTEAAPVKTVNDPCPAGFRLITRNEWVALDANNTATRTGSFTFGNTQYGSALHYGDATNPKKLTLPASGNRTIVDNGSGELDNRGFAGYYWSSTESPTIGNTLQSHRLVFGKTTKFAASAFGRLVGCSVRCIAE